VGEDAVGLPDFFGQARGHYPAVRHLEELIFDRGTSGINHKNDHDVTSTQAILEVDDNSSLNLAAMHARENVVNVVERFRGDGRLDSLTLPLSPCT
jgi:hypothetical protein